MIFLWTLILKSSTFFTQISRFVWSRSTMWFNCLPFFTHDVLLCIFQLFSYFLSQLNFCLYYPSCANKLESNWVRRLILVKRSRSLSVAPYSLETQLYYLVILSTYSALLKLRIISGNIVFAFIKIRANHNFDDTLLFSPYPSQTHSIDKAIPVLMDQSSEIHHIALVFYFMQYRRLT